MQCLRIEIFPPHKNSLQNLPECSDGRSQPGFDGTQWNTGFLGSLLLRITFKIHQINEGTILVVELFDCVAHAYVIGIDTVSAGLLCQRLRAFRALAVSEMRRSGGINSGIACDIEQPGKQASLLPVVSSGIPPGFKESILQGLLSQLLILNDAQDNAIERSPVSVVQRSDYTGIALLQPLNELVLHYVVVFRPAQVRRRCISYTQPTEKRICANVQIFLHSAFFSQTLNILHSEHCFLRQIAQNRFICNAKNMGTPPICRPFIHPACRV